MSLTPPPESAQLELFGIVAEEDRSIYLLGPHEPGFWQAFTSTPEYNDGEPDPLDRWSKRVIGALALDWGGRAIFPSDGPPYPPFLDWAKKSGRAWISPVGLMVHDVAGLWLSFRGAVEVPETLALPQQPGKPCDTCAGQPCQSACPVNAMSADNYDVGKCHDWLNQPRGVDCMQQGCAIRRACPISRTYGRVEAQSAFHMKAFHPK